MDDKTSNDETTTATPREMPPWSHRADYVNAACKVDKQKAETAKARTALRQEENRLLILEKAEAEAYWAMVDGGRHDHG